MNSTRVKACVQDTPMTFFVSKNEAKEYAYHVGEMVSVPTLGPLWVQEVRLDEDGMETGLTFFATTRRDIAQHVMTISRIK